MLLLDCWAKFMNPRPERTDHIHLNDLVHSATARYVWKAVVSTVAAEDLAVLRVAAVLALLVLDLTPFSSATSTPPNLPYSTWMSREAQELGA